PEEGDRGGARFGRAHDPMANRGFANLLHERMGGIERRGGALSDIGDLRPAQRAPFIRADRSDILAAKDNVAADDVAATARVAHRGEADRRFARAGFTNEANDLAAPQLHGDAHAANVEDDRAVALTPSAFGS